MMVSWKEFAQRRKLNLEMFAKMTYKDYCDWCSIRSVEPVSQDSFEGVKSILSPKVSEPIVEKKESISFDAKELRKMRKTALTKLCQKHDVEYEETLTKNQLVRLLLALNNNV